MKKCPHCGEEILERAVKCKYCKKYLDSENQEIETKDIKPKKMSEQQQFWIVRGVAVVILLLICFIFLMK